MRTVEGAETLGEGECRRLLSRVPVGRIAFTARALPAVQPVPFALDGTRVVVAAVPGSTLAVSCPGTVVAFEADGWEPDGGAWAVTVVGPARVAHAEAEVARLDRLHLPSWSPSAGRCYLVIENGITSGWQMPPGSVGVRRSVGTDGRASA
ncbi:pyridoxamine 5'-phosphate oxidase family protein [Blastococcus sp. TF02A-26]|uniref:pyridoxamine 5'-phosphate oxidase family protein n=1 Tax=Blastococcus sp. TF02A-26 TaxID=2250577 RepID=UPI000DEAC4C7|nr:pyridoxamine 5'-phosphate oxidase family protein [Blastococcus sp. TF02A-26]RBY84787.1 pyridoxamine 5'-phosphate oxidase family protein [Blastococcus sp. TF02A-26]